MLKSANNITQKGKKFNDCEGNNIIKTISESYSRHNKTSLTSWVLALISPFSVLYLFIFYEELTTRVATPTNANLIISMAGILLEAARRTVGMPIIVLFFYCIHILGSICP
ncbi:hypothetical protein [Candidatus Mesenet endosymbiont of Agriotes lineatus]|uniref:hypothetical protein n=1 Tax=Candidatus Mesenet endosymbiont of Agriotes lineatus TaxID=3077948 RepID=UPI0030CFEABE